jgi:CRISPR-associated protein Csy1
MTHPDSPSNVTIKEEKLQNRNDGYIHTGNIKNVKLDEIIDIATNAGVNSKILKEYKSSSEEEKERFINEKPNTDFMLKQVYFPINNGEEELDYHVLSVLNGTGLMRKVNEKIKGIIYDKEKKSKLPNVHKISFGGSKPQNISIINSKQQFFRLLPSLTPTFDEIITPKRDFFIECLKTRELKEHFKVLIKDKKKAEGKEEKAKKDMEENFKELGKFGRKKIQNMEAKDKRDEALKQILQESTSSVLGEISEASIFSVMAVVKKIRLKNPEGWTRDEKFSKLPDYQKIWLDEERKDERNDKDYIYSLAKRAAEWIIKTYERTYEGMYKHLLNDDDLEFLIKHIKKEELLND